MKNDDIEFIKQPFLTEDGFVNPAFMKELEALIRNMPKTHDRLSEDPEWNTPRIVMLRQITGYFAQWSVRQIGSTAGAKDAPAFFPGLEKLIGYLHACLLPLFDEHGVAELSLCDVSRLLYNILYDQNITLFDNWNKEDVVGPFWLDLDALLHNVCISIRDERRKNDAFDAEFEKEWKVRTDS